MIEIIVYSTIDGTIIKSVTCKESDAPFQCMENQSWMQHAPVDDSAFKVNLSTMEIVPID